MSLNCPHIETERKFLIEYPDKQQLLSIDGARLVHITQTYLKSTPEVTSRVRKIQTDTSTEYIKTTKKRIDALSCIEDETSISSLDYQMLLEDADPESLPIKKERIKIPHGSLVLEIDIYDFWSDRAILEIELESPEQDYSIPDYISVISEVTSDKRYKNAYLAKALYKKSIAF